MPTPFHHHVWPGKLRLALRCNCHAPMLAILLACSALQPGIARADACGPARGGPPTSCSASAPASLDSGAPDAAAGNPINVITGNKYQREEDMPALPGVLGLEIVRHYNSAYVKPGSPNGPMGREWKLSYETELVDKYGRIQILQADGARVIFSRDPKNPHLCTTSLPANGRLAIVPDAQGAPAYVWTWPNGRRLSFNHAGKLERIVAPTGEAVTLSYDTENVLIRVADPQGRSLALNYLERSARTNDRFRGVQSIDSPVGRFSYEYGSAIPTGGTPFDARILLANLVRVRLPTSYDPDRPAHALTSRGSTASTVSRLYHHEDPRFPWLLTGISIETMVENKPVTTRYATYGYDSNGLANLSTHMNDVDKVTLSYPGGGTTVLTNSLGRQTVYRHAIVGGEFRLLEVRGAGCATCGETNVRYGYDRLGQLVETTRLNAAGLPLGAIRRELDKLGRIVQVGKADYQHGKPGPLQWQLRYEYQGDHDAPALIARPGVVPGREHRIHITYNSSGQPLRVTELGWIPGYDGKQAAARMERSTTYEYATINGHSVLTRIDGPLPNGPTNSPQDSDVTLLEYDRQPDNDGAAPAPAGKLARYDERQGRGLLTRVIAPGNVTHTLEYDHAGRIGAISDTHGHTTRFSYMPRGQLLSQTRDGIAQLASYDALDHPVEMGYWTQNEYRAIARLGYDGAGRPAWIAQAIGIAATLGYDTENRLLEASTRSGAIRKTDRYAYDALGRPLTHTAPDGGVSHTAWNASGLPETAIDTLGRVTRYRYDAAGRLAAIMAPDGGETRFDSGNGAVTIVAPNGAATTTQRDDFGRPVATIGADSGKTVRAFDAADRLISATDANGNHASYAYDLENRIVRQTVTAAGGPPAVTTWRYASGRLIAVDDARQSDRYDYDQQGHARSKTTVLTLDDGTRASYTRHFHYDQLGQLAGVTLPDGSVLAYRRNGQNQAVAVTRQPLGESWLRWLTPAQTIIHRLERDAAGLSHIGYGNGIEAIYQRSQEGVLARSVLRKGGPSTPGATFATWPGIGPAAAQPPAQAAQAGHAATLPGALGLPSDSTALIDHRYLWDTQGNLLHVHERDGGANYAYDALDRLIVAAVARPTPLFSRYHYDGNGNRLLAQEGIANQRDVQSSTVPTPYVPQSNRPQMPEMDDANGQPLARDGRLWVWDALGRLVEVRQGQHIIARYRYNHRGERIAKEAGGVHTYYLYDNKQLAAELDGAGHITRQYVYLADQPVAIIDRTGGHTGNNTGSLAAVWRAWFGRNDNIAYLHQNHLGATELVTGADGKPLWRATYAPFGKAETSGFQFNLRLPGQYEDRETGLYYNGHRYYDPARGRYLTPDPLGLRAGPNGYAYAAGNPLKYIDPQGLILFAFDGTGNSDPPQAGDSISNVRKFFRAYDQTANGLAYYVTGIGTTNEDMPYKGRVTDGDGFDPRVSLGFNYLDDFFKTDAGTDTVDVDVVGYSRGAAEARVWVNQLVSKLRDGAYTAYGKTRCVNLRFEGLWDTVPHLGKFGGDESKYDFNIPDAVRYAVHANALNEYRGALISFDFRSILPGPTSTGSSTRIEKGFLGSHSDIGGGFGTGDLSNIALMWMIDQARTQGIKFTSKTINDNNWNVVATPVLHDKSSNLFNGPPTDASEDRKVIYTNGSVVKQRKATTGTMTYADTSQFINYLGNPLDFDLISANVDAKAYLQWLNAHGYGVNSVTVLGGKP